MHDIKWLKNYDGSFFGQVWTCKVPFLCVHDSKKSPVFHQYFCYLNIINTDFLATTNFVSSNFYSKAPEEPLYISNIIRIKSFNYHNCYCLVDCDYLFILAIEHWRYLKLQFWAVSFKFNADFYQIWCPDLE